LAKEEETWSSPPSEERPAREKRKRARQESKKERGREKEEEPPVKGRKGKSKKGELLSRSHKSQQRKERKGKKDRLLTNKKKKKKADPPPEIPYEGPSQPLAIVKGKAKNRLLLKKDLHRKKGTPSLLTDGGRRKKTPGQLPRRTKGKEEKAPFCLHRWERNPAGGEKSRRRP